MASSFESQTSSIKNREDLGHYINGIGENNEIDLHEPFIRHMDQILQDETFRINDVTKCYEVEEYSDLIVLKLKVKKKIAENLVSFYVELIRDREPKDIQCYHTRYTTEADEFFNYSENDLCMLSDFLENLNIRKGILLPKIFKCAYHTPHYFGKHGKCHIIKTRKNLRKYKYYLEHPMTDFQPLETDKNVLRKPFSIENIDHLYFFSEDYDNDKEKRYLYLYCRLDGNMYVYICCQSDKNFEKSSDFIKRNYNSWYTHNPKFFFREVIEKDTTSGIQFYRKRILRFFFEEDVELSEISDEEEEERRKTKKTKKRRRRRKK